MVSFYSRLENNEEEKKQDVLIDCGMGQDRMEHRLWDGAIYIERERRATFGGLEPRNHRLRQVGLELSLEQPFLFFFITLKPRVQ